MKDRKGGREGWWEGKREKERRREKIKLFPNSIYISIYILYIITEMHNFFDYV